MNMTPVPMTGEDYQLAASFVAANLSEDNAGLGGLLRHLFAVTPERAPAVLLSLVDIASDAVTASKGGDRQAALAKVQELLVALAAADAADASGD